MTKKSIWIAVSVLLVLGLLIGSFGCAKEAPAPAPTPAPAPKPTPKPTPTPAPTPAAPEVIKWRGQLIYNYPVNPLPDRMPIWCGTESAWHFVNWVKERSGGRLEIDLAPSGSIVPAAESLTAIEEGILDFVGHTYAGYYTGTFPEGNIEIGMPFAFENIAEGWDALYNWGLDKEFKAAYAEHNAYPITFYMGGLYSFFSSFDISSPDAIKGKKIRALGIYGDLVELLGGSPVVVPGAELYMAMKLGTVDGGIYGINGLDDNMFKEVQDYFVVNPNLNTIGITFLSNIDKFNALPEDIRTMIEEDAPYIMTGWGNGYSTFGLRMGKLAAKEGYIKLVSWSDEDAAKVRKLGIGLWDKMAAASPRCAKMVDIVKAQARELGKL